MRWPHWIDPADPRLAPGRPPARNLVNGRVRKCPQMRLHARLNLAYAAFKVRGKRRTVYFGPWESPTAKARYAAFRRQWPSQLSEPPPSGGRWPGLRLLTHDDRTQTVTRWAEETGIKATTIRFRLDVRGWSIAKALTTPVKKWTRRAG